MDEILNQLIEEYYKLFPNAHFCYEWFDISQNEQIEILKECIKDKKDITQTKLFEKYQETGIDIEEKRKCKCCGKYTLDKNSIYDICPICGWESDPIQEENPNIEGGANELSLNQYKKEIFNKRDLKVVLTDFLNNFNAHDINEYFANGFSDDWNNYLKNGTPIEVLDYLNDSFYDIDIDYRDTDMFENIIKEILNKALKLLKDNDIKKCLIKANELLNDKSLCLLKYADNQDYVLFTYGTKDGKSIFDDTLIKVDKKTQIASYYKIVEHLKEIEKLQFKSIK